MATSEEYLAKLGFDTSDVDKAVSQTVTLLGNLGSQFGQIEKQTSKAERALLGTTRATQSSGSTAKKTSSDMLALNQSLYDQAKAYRDVQAAQKVASGNQGRMTANESAFAKYIAEGEANSKAAQGIQSKARALDQERDSTTRLNQARTDAIAGQRAEETARKSELTALRSAIQGRAQLAAEETKTAAAAEKAAAAAARAAAADAKRNRGLLEQIEVLPRLRYALYDVGAVALTTSATLAGIGLAAGTAFASYESAFTNVERTVDLTADSKVGVDDLRSSLMQLSREIPLSFQELSGIATLGNQLGVEAENIEGFTGTVARFSAVAGVGFEETAKSFGSMTEILGVAETDYERLGSSIALVGRRSVATESEILSLTREIGQQAKQSGFTAEEVVGLAGALGELRVPPERARGALTTYFQTLTQAVAEGGDRLNDFATVVGMSSEELSAAVQNGQGLEIFQRFLTALGSTDTVTATQALDRLGLSQLRVSDVFQRLASNTDVFNTSIANGRQGWNDQTELARQYALVVDDLASRWQIFVNALMGFGAAVGAQVAPAFIAVMDAAGGLLVTLTGFVDSPFGGFVTRMVAVIFLLVGAYAALRGGIALATGAMLALRTAAAALGGAGLIANIRVLAASLGLIKLNADGAKVGTIGLTNALRGLLRATIIIGVLSLLTEVLFDVKGAGDAVIDTMFGVASAAQQAAANILNFIGAAANVDTLKQAGAALQYTAGATDRLKGTVKGEWGNFARDMGWIKDETMDLGTAAEAAFPNVTDLGGGIEDLGSGAEDAAPKVRTLVDYASDLSGVMSRAFDIRFGSATAYDQIASSWNSIAQGIRDTNDEIAKYRAEMTKLSADKALREYWLKVAQNYGDSLRAGELRAEIADIDVELAKNASSLSKAQDKNSKVLEGNSQAAVDNRAELLGLVGGYQSYIEKLAAAGVPQERLQAEAARLREEFIRQAVQMGYSRGEVEKYARSFDDMALAIARVPRNVTVNADANPALQALNEFFAQAKQKIGSGLNVPITSSYDGAGAAKSGRAAQLQADLLSWQKSYERAIASGADNQATRALDNINRISGILNSGSYQSGTAWTGNGPANGIAGVVHNRERVLNERGSKMVSAQFVNAANQGRNPWRYAPSGGGGVTMPRTMMVELSPIDRELLASGQQVTVMVGADQIAGAVNGSNADDSRRSGS